MKKFIAVSVLVVMSSVMASESVDVAVVDERFPLPKIIGDKDVRSFGPRRPLDLVPVQRNAFSRAFIRNGELLTDDAFFAQQHHFARYNTEGSEGGSNIGDALDKTVQNQRIRIAVLDTTFYRHPDINYSSESLDVDGSPYIVYDEFGLQDGTETLYNWIYMGDDPVDADWDLRGYTSGRPSSFCSLSHGTGTVGAIASISDNGIGIAGIGDFDVIPIRIGDCKFGSPIDGAWAALGEYSPSEQFLLDQGFRTVSELHPRLDEPADIISISYGSYASFNNGVCDDENGWGGVFSKAEELGVVIVVAAGNDGGNVLQQSPGGCDWPITVGAVNQYGEVTAFTNYGPRVDVSALGRDVILPSKDASGYELMSGTSFSTPIVAGIIGLGKQKYPQATQAVMEQALKATANPYKLGTADTLHCNEDGSVCYYEDNECEGLECSGGIADANQFIEYLDGVYGQGDLKAIHPNQSNDRSSKSALYEHFADAINYCSIREAILPNYFKEEGTFINLYSLPKGSGLARANGSFLMKIEEIKAVLPDLDTATHDYAFEVCSANLGCIVDDLTIIDSSTYELPLSCSS